VIVIIFAMTSTIVSTVYARHLTTLKVARRALLYGLAIQLVSLIVVFTQDYRSASLLADAGSVRAWILCIGLAVMQGLTDSLVINGTNAIIPMQYEHSLVPGGFAMSMAFRGLGQCLMFLSAAVITFEFQRIMFIVVLAPALLSLLVLVHSTNETRLSQNLTWSDLLDDISRAPSAVAMAFVSDAKSVQRFVCCHREKSRNNDATT
jgi:MFS family permease